MPIDIEAYTIELLAQGDYFSDAQIFTLDVSVGFGEFGQKEVNVYPNPTRQKINIDNVEGAYIVVYNMLGEVITEVNDAKQKELIDLNGNRNGIYFVRILNGTEVITRKINLVR